MVQLSGPSAGVIEVPTSQQALGFKPPQSWSPTHASRVTLIVVADFHSSLTLCVCCFWPERVVVIDSVLDTVSSELEGLSRLPTVLRLRSIHVVHVRRFFLERGDAGVIFLLELKKDVFCIRSDARLPATFRPQIKD